MLAHIRPAFVLLVLLTLVTGLAYPLAVTGLAGVLFPAQAEGSLVRGRDGRVLGSSLIGQAFTSERYFHGRPSATTAADPNDPGKTVAAPYNAASSSGSNLGPTNQALIDRVRQDLEVLKAENPGRPVPVDLVTTSASGLDPDVSPEAARFQVPRVAKVRGLPEDQVLALVAEHTEVPAAGILGDPRVNILALNLALDSLNP
jgi:K+-transporting ATPase ATPase C chain